MPHLADYELLAKIASGGMAEIWVARRRGEGAVCVVKRLLPQHSGKEDFLQMFLEEGRVAASLVHPNVVRTLDVGSDGDSHYIAMEYLQGEDLRSALRALRARGATMPVSHAVRVVEGAAAALHYVHEARDAERRSLGIVHRDVSPHNVIVTFDGDVKLVDFGIAKSEGRSWETRHGTLKGKVPYMSPEQVKGRRLDRRSDIYSLGVVLHELLVGQRPYVLAASGDFATMMAIARHDVRRPTLVSPQLPAELEQIVMTAMAYEPHERYADAAQMQRALARFAERARHPRGEQAGAELATFLEQLFGDRRERWKEASRSPEDLAAHVVFLSEARAGDPADEGLDAPTEPLEGPAPELDRRALPTRSPALAGVHELLGVTVASLHGRVDERFEGAALARSLGDPEKVILFDLDGVERITSFGVREWLEMMTVLADRAGPVWLARCSEAVVTQLSLIREFVGPATLASFHVPFLCDDCGNAFPRTLDVERDADAIVSSARGQAGQGRAMATCPRCGGAASMDDDPLYLAFAAGSAGKPLPPQIRLLLDSLDERDRAAGDVVEKRVTASETHLSVRRQPEPGFRWSRVFDGIEGAMTLDFRTVSRFTREGAARLVQALAALGPEVSSCEIIDAPSEVARELLTGHATPGYPGPASSSRIRVASIAVEGRCEGCRAPRDGVLPMETVHLAQARGERPVVPCRRCGAALVVELDALEAGRPVAPPPPSTSLAVSREAPAPVPARRLHRGSALAVMAALVAVSSVASVAVLRSQRRGSSTAGAARAAGSLVTPSASTTSALATSAPAASSVVTPTTSASMVPDDGGFAITVVVEGPGESRAAAEARPLAVRALVDAITARLPPLLKELRPLRTDGRGRPDPERREDDPALVAERFTRDVGAFASPERVDLAPQGASAILVRYRLSTEAFERAVEAYASTRSVGGVTFARALPTRGEGVIVAAVEPGRPATLVPGLTLVALDGTRVPSLEALPALPPLPSPGAPRARHEALFAGPGSGGGTFTVRLGPR